MMYKEADGRVTLEMSRDDYELLLMMLGAALFTAVPNRELLNHYVEVVNRLNEGNPRYTPYAVTVDTGRRPHS